MSQPTDYDPDLSWYQDSDGHWHAIPKLNTANSSTVHTTRADDHREDSGEPEADIMARQSQLRPNVYPHSRGPAMPRTGAAAQLADTPGSGWPDGIASPLSLPSFQPELRSTFTPSSTSFSLSSSGHFRLPSLPAHIRHPSHSRDVSVGSVENIEPGFTARAPREHLDNTVVDSLLMTKRMRTELSASTRARSVAAPSAKRTKPSVGLSAKNAKGADKGGKGKGLAKPAAEPEPSRSGRQPGALNYNHDDIDVLLDVVEQTLPIGQSTWQRVCDSFNDWAKANKRPLRTYKPLKSKFDALVRTPKPTGDAEVPPHVERAWAIEQSINEAVHLRQLDDSEIADANESEDRIHEVKEESDSDIEILDGPPPKKAKMAAPVAKAFRSDSVSHRQPRTQSRELTTAILGAFNPAARDSRDEARFNRNLAATQIASLNDEIRELRARNESLRDRLEEATQRTNQEAMRASTLQARLDMEMAMRSVLSGSRGFGRRRRHHHVDDDDLFDESPTSSPRRLSVRRDYHPPALHSSSPPPPHSSSPLISHPPLSQPLSSSAREPLVQIQTPPSTGLSLLANAAQSQASSSIASGSASVTLTFTPTRNRKGELTMDITPSKST